MQIEQQRILLTGASGGIGQALAHELTARGARLGLVGRSPEPLARLAAALSGGPGEALAIPADLRLGTGRESARRHPGKTNDGTGTVERLLAHARESCAGRRVQRIRFPVEHIADPCCGVLLVVMLHRNFTSCCLSCCCARA